jgi:pimeloyl-ACP methyl ester carboxylesterase
MTIRTARHGDIEIAYESFGAATGQPLLLVMGIGGQMLSWPEGFCRRLVDHGFCVIRFDNRDAGLSTRFTAAGRPNQLTMLLRPAAAAVYRLQDMADDAIAVLDAQGWSAAHVVGISQGGMIAQTMAVHHPDRVRSLTSISSTPAPRLGQPRPRTLLKILKVANPKRINSAEDLARYMLELHLLVGSPAYPADPAALRELAHQCYERGGLDQAAVQRQTAAIAASGDRRAELANIQAPTLVIHGEDDPLIRLPAGKATADAIPGARLITYPGMGHDLPAALWTTIIDQISQLATQATTEPAQPDQPQASPPQSAAHNPASPQQFEKK